MTRHLSIWIFALIIALAAFVIWNKAANATPWRYTPPVTQEGGK